MWHSTTKKQKLDHQLPAKGRLLISPLTGRFTWVIHEGSDPNVVILSEAPARLSRPAALAGRAGAQSKDPYMGRHPRGLLPVLASFHFSLSLAMTG